MDTTELAAVVEAFYSAWSARDQQRLLAMWATDDPACSYLPAKAERRLIGADAVTGFIAERTTTFQTIRMRPHNIHLRRLTDDLGSLFAEVDWALKKTSTSKAIGGTLRVSGVLRRSAGSWRFCHYAEAPLAPLVELRGFYQTIGADGHEALT